jgi:hypothetical protein
VVRDKALGWDVDVPDDLGFDHTAFEAPCQ